MDWVDKLIITALNSLFEYMIFPLIKNKIRGQTYNEQNENVTIGADSSGGAGNAQ